MPPKTQSNPLHTDFQILQIVANHTSHNYAMGSYVITAQSLSPSKNEECVYTLADSIHYGQHLSAKCASPVTQLPMTYRIGITAAEYVSALDTWKLNLSISNKSFPPTLLYSIARTQKARGLQTLLTLGLLRQSVSFVNKPVSKDFTDFPVMARPCPTKPRHGFVDSRIVHTVDELNEVFHETKQQDPHGEVILMDPIKSTFSAVITDTAITLGKGTDGATSGTKSISIACHSNIREVLRALGKTIIRRTRRGKSVRIDTLKFAGIRPTHGLFVESVGSTLVQLRTGPQVDYAQTRYSTASLVKLNTVFEPEPGMDFLFYEQKLDNLDQYCTDECLPPASIGIRLRHGSLSCHYAVQAIARGFSVFTGSETIKAGEVYAFKNPITTHVAINPSYRKAITKAVDEGVKLTPNAKNVEWAVAIIQGLGGTTRTEASCGLLIAAGVLLARTGVALCFGEHRHFYRIGPGKKQGLIAMGPVIPPFTADECTNKELYDRDAVYTAAFKLAWNTLPVWHTAFAHMELVEHDFRYGSWAGGYGGVKWAECTRATKELLLAVIPFVQVTKDSPMLTSLTDTHYTEALSRVIGAANKLITLSHNSSKCLTKIVNAKTLQMITIGKAGLSIATHSSTWNLVK